MRLKMKMQTKTNTKIKKPLKNPARQAWILSVIFHACLGCWYTTTRAIT